MLLLQQKITEPATPCEKVGQNKQSFLCPVSSLGLEEQSVKCAAPFKPGRWFFIMKSVELDIFTSADPQNLRASLVTTLGCTDRAGPELVLR